MKTPKAINPADLLDLGKPRITSMVLFTTALGLWMAPGSLGWMRTALFLLATSMLVASANTLNCWVERESDGLMRRTRNRPLPAGRLEPTVALLWGIALAAISLSLLWATTNVLTFALGAGALSTYVLLYTPLKRVGWWALLVGAVPGAMPPLMGWTALTNSLSVEGWVLFGILFFWQLPHFVAISLYLKDDYFRGGLRVLPVVYGDPVARRHLFVYTLLLVAVSLGVSVLGLAGTAYAIAASLLGGGFMALAALGLRSTVRAGWARQAFAYSLIYLPLLIGVLVIDAR
jgi:protoheme IX farnesyltransferase